MAPREEDWMLVAPSLELEPRLRGNNMNWKDWVFRLRDDGVVTVDPPLTGEEEDPLTLAIKKWEFIAHCVELGYRVTSTGGSHTCALCKRYRWVVPACDRCPVRRFTGQQYCNGTPIEFLEDTCAMTLTPTIAKAVLYSLMALRDRITQGE